MIVLPFLGGTVWHSLFNSWFKQATLFSDPTVPKWESSHLATFRPGVLHQAVQFRKKKSRTAWSTGSVIRDRGFHGHGGTQNRWFSMENPIKNGWYLGASLLMETPKLIAPYPCNYPQIQQPAPSPSVAQQLPRDWGVAKVSENLGGMIYEFIFLSNLNTVSTP